LLSSVSQYGPREGRTPATLFVAPLRTPHFLNFSAPSFSSGSLTASSVRADLLSFERCDGRSWRLFWPAFFAASLIALRSTWAADTHRERLIDRFLAGTFAPPKKSAVLRGPDVWCVSRDGVAPYSWPAPADAGADAPRREARKHRFELRPVASTMLILPQGAPSPPDSMNFSFRSSNPCGPINCRKDLSRGAMKALDTEKVSRGPPALLAAFLESLGRIAVNRGDYFRFRIQSLTGLERLPHDKEHDPHVSARKTAWWRRIAGSCWRTLHWPTAHWIPSFLGSCSRDPERLLDRFDFAAHRTPRGRNGARDWLAFCGLSAFPF